MNCREILSLLDLIGAVSGKAKIESMKSFKYVELREVLALCYDPQITFGINKNKLDEVLASKSIDMMQGPVDVEWSDMRVLLAALMKRKLTGNAAVEAAARMIYGSRPAYDLFTRIVSKDARCGVAASSVLKAYPKLFEVFKVQLSKPFEIERCIDMSEKRPWLIEPKYDGVRAVAQIEFVSEDLFSVRLLSREGNHFPGYSTLEQRISSWANFNGIRQSMYLDGEITSGNFNKTVGSAKRKNDDDKEATYFVFDRFGQSKLSDAMPLKERREGLEYMIWTEHVQLIEQREVATEEEIREVYQEYRDKGLEGAMVKDPNAPYVYKRFFHWMKLKDENTVECEIVGWQEGTGKNVGKLGALVVDFKGVQVNVGSGLSDEQRQDFWEERHNLLTRIVEVEYHMVTPDGSLRHPRFVRFRDALTGEME